jgi:DNA helicase II / ATP-dependent DNA helicase PcrA
MQILRKEIARLGYTRDFSLYDEKDMKRLLTQMARLMLEHEGDLPSLQPTFAKIAEARSQGISPLREQTTEMTWHEKFTADLYSRLHHCMRAYNAVDFDSLLVLTVQLFEEHPVVLASFQERYQYIMIDEYQDTNPIQYRLASLLAEKHQNLCVVGDDDQSIYGWRGADIKHILHFTPDHTIKLEQNYRSTPTILKAANAVISHNKKRHHKELWSDGPSGEEIELFHAPTDTDEAEAVVQRLIKLHTEHKIPWRDMAILYRSNLLSRPLETALIHAAWPDNGRWMRGIPYRIFGGTELYERSEIKDLMAYLRTISNPSDEEAILRIINVPRRGISDQALDKITAYNRAQKIPLWDLLLALKNGAAPFAMLRADLSERAIKGIESFVNLIEKYQTAFTQPPFHLRLQTFMDEIDYKKAISEEVKSDKMREFKWQNIEQYIESLKRYETESPLPSLVDFVSHYALGKDNWLRENRSLHEDRLNLMTFHSAKGLEFTACFLISLEDHIIPHEKSLQETGIEEERRLMYVAITRAKKHLCLSMARKRKKMGKDIDSAPSRFLFEIPKEILKVSSWRFT